MLRKYFSCLLRSPLAFARYKVFGSDKPSVSFSFGCGAGPVSSFGISAAGSSAGSTGSAIGTLVTPGDGADSKPALGDGSIGDGAGCVEVDIASSAVVDSGVVETGFTDFVVAGSEAAGVDDTGTDIA